jgi:ribosomal-protein-alanine N-acetyltransferase
MIMMMPAEIFMISKSGLKHMGTVNIETIRLRLRKFKIEDAKDMFLNWASDPEVCKYLSWGPYSDPNTCYKRVTNWVNSYTYDNTYVWAIELKGKDTVIGSISVEITNDTIKSCEVGYCIGRPYWNRGIMTEALRAVMHFLFYEIGYQVIIAKHDILNKASGKVMQKAGMQFVKLEIQVGLRRDGSYYDCAVYAKNVNDE